MLDQLRPYTVPVWCRDALLHPPAFGRIQLANLPTPLYRIIPAKTRTDRNTNPPLSPSASNSIQALPFSELTVNMQFWIKRDDATHGCELGGNKIRKLEFLLADAVDGHFDSVLTIGGLQSNHCRATACASRMLGLEPHLILRTSSSNRRSGSVTAEEKEDVGLVGNLLFDRLVGAHIYTCTPGEYGRIGSEALLARLATYLQQPEQNQRPYVIPVGGSNGIGTWGYIQAVEELMQQWHPADNNNSATTIDRIVVACGSGGTAAGLALGVALAKRHPALSAHVFHENTTVHAVGVCDDEEYFYNHITKIATEMGLVLPTNDGDDDHTSAATTIPEFLRRNLVMHQGKGLGYAQSTRDELEFIAQFARDTGIVLDPVYTGKAFYNFVREVEARPEQYHNQTILFWHTGGSLGMFDKSDDLMEELRNHAPSCQRLDVYGKGIGLAI